MNQGIIAIGAHPDDIELGCGASLAKLSKEGFNIFAVVLSSGSKGNPFNQNRIEESSQALSILGVNKTFFLDFEDTKLALNLHEIIISLEKILKDISSQSNIERIYTMFEEDRHQDHRAIYDASIVAFRTVAQILCYETPSSGTYFNPKVFERVDEIFLDKKIKALQHHQSQMHRNYMSENFIRSVAIFRGQQAGFSLGEGFVPYKMVL
jgi:LmbE family N-acetylglucosaminyl deacetylase